MKKEVLKIPASKPVMPKYNAYQSGYGEIKSEKDKLKDRNSKQSKRQKYKEQNEYSGG